MSRRAARICAVQFLYRIDFIDYPDFKQVIEDIDIFCHDNCKNISAKDKDFVYKLIRGTIANIDDIDLAIKESAQRWRFERIAQMDKTILRCAIYELLFCSEIPSSVSINEALEIAKQFSTIESVAFINGILDNVAKTHGFRK